MNHEIVVTGNMGYVGASVVQHLRASFPESTLIGFDIGYFGSCVTGTDVLPECRLDVQYFGDMRNFDPAAACTVQQKIAHGPRSPR